MQQMQRLWSCIALKNPQNATDATMQQMHPYGASGGAASCRLPYVERPSRGAQRPVFAANLRRGCGGRHIASGPTHQILWHLNVDKQGMDEHAVLHSCRFLHCCLVDWCAVH